MNYQPPAGYRWEGRRLCMECGDGLCLRISEQILANEFNANDLALGVNCYGCGKQLVEPNV